MRKTIAFTAAALLAGGTLWFFGRTVPSSQQECDQVTTSIRQESQPSTIAAPATVQRADLTPEAPATAPSSVPAPNKAMPDPDTTTLGQDRSIQWRVAQACALEASGHRLPGILTVPNDVGAQIKALIDPFYMRSITIDKEISAIMNVVADEKIKNGDATLFNERNPKERKASKPQHRNQMVIYCGADDEGHQYVVRVDPGERSDLDNLQAARRNEMRDCGMEILRLLDPYLSKYK